MTAELVHLAIIAGREQDFLALESFAFISSRRPADVVDFEDIVRVINLSNDSPFSQANPSIVSPIHLRTLCHNRVSICICRLRLVVLPSLLIHHDLAITPRTRHPTRLLTPTQRIHRPLMRPWQLRFLNPLLFEISVLPDTRHSALSCRQRRLMLWYMAPYSDRLIVGARHQARASFLSYLEECLLFL